MRYKTSTLCEIAILVAMISILGSIKIPNIIPGIEFQLSAPLAVAICSVFGFKKYIISGILSSVICLALGTQNILNVAIAMQFRLIVGLLLYLAQNHLYMIIFAGPIASLIARFSLFFFLGNLGALTFSMILFTIHGLIFTAIASPILVNILKKIIHKRR
ncbi:hypothetical protein [Megamonas sp.]|uniref:hypothetical protein n=1 Tax=Megamonas sp. TaxID=2049033 RepID=UPI00258513A8|nr:hypothetical protein [Megamonas sp.]